MNLAGAVQTISTKNLTRPEFQSQIKRTCCVSGVGGNLSDTSEARLVDVEELAEIFSVTKNWIYQRTRRNEIPCVKFGKHLRFDVGEVRRFFQEKEKGKT